MVVNIRSTNVKCQGLLQTRYKFLLEFLPQKIIETSLILYAIEFYTSIKV